MLTSWVCDRFAFANLSNALLTGKWTQRQQQQLSTPTTAIAYADEADAITITLTVVIITVIIAIQAEEYSKKLHYSSCSMCPMLACLGRWAASDCIGTRYSYSRCCWLYSIMDIQIITSLAGEDVASQTNDDAFLLPNKTRRRLRCILITPIAIQNTANISAD